MVMEACWRRRGEGGRREVTGRATKWGGRLRGDPEERRRGEGGCREVAWGGSRGEASI
jgi:hypothetical protein